MPVPADSGTGQARPLRPREPRLGENSLGKNTQPVELHDRRRGDPCGRPRPTMPVPADSGTGQARPLRPREPRLGENSLGKNTQPVELHDRRRGDPCGRPRPTCRFLRTMGRDRPVRYCRRGQEAFAGTRRSTSGWCNVVASRRNIASVSSQPTQASVIDTP